MTVSLWSAFDRGDRMTVVVTRAKHSASGHSEPGIDLHFDRVLSPACRAASSSNTRLQARRSKTARERGLSQSVDAPDRVRSVCHRFRQVSLEAGAVTVAAALHRLGALPG